jgi:hypothetical protein
VHDENGKGVFGDAEKHRLTLEPFQRDSHAEHRRLLTDRRQYTQAASRVEARSASSPNERALVARHDLERRGSQLQRRHVP